MDYLTSNVDESKYIIYGYISQTDKDGIYFVGIVELSVLTIVSLWLLIVA